MVDNRGDAEDGWLAAVIERTIHRQLREHQDCRFFVVNSGPGVQRIELAYRRGPAAVTIDVSSGTEPPMLASASAASIEAVVARVVQTLAREVGNALSVRGPDPREAAEMERIGAPSFDLYRRYGAVLRGFHATGLPDLHELVAMVRRILAADPGWARPYALLASLEGRTTDEARRTIEAAIGSASAVRDPAGMKLIGAYDLMLRQDFESAFEVLVTLVQDDPTDLLVGRELMVNAIPLHRIDEAMAVARRLHNEYPELECGVDLAGLFRRTGRDAEADRAIRDSVAVAPENVAARVELVRIEASADRLAEARGHVHDLLLIHGERDEILPEIYEALIASDQVAAAHRIADRMLIGNSLTRARGRYRIAVAAVIEGRFAAAYDSIRRAIDEHRVFGIQSELLQCLELARAIAPLVADVEAQRRYTSELAETFATLVGDMGTAAATRYELALIDRRRELPSIDEHLVGLVDGPMRDVARRRMLRAAAVADCGSAHKAVAAGFSAFEENTASLVAFALCACRIGEIELARRSLERAVGLWSSLLSNQNSPYHAVLARFHLAGVLFEMGERAASRAAYEAFLRCWSDPDRPIPEVGIARRMLEQIQ